MRLHGGQCRAVLQWLLTKVVPFNSQNLPVLSSVPASGSGGRYSRPSLSTLVREQAEETVNARRVHWSCEEKALQGQLPRATLQYFHWAVGDVVFIWHA